MPTANDVEYQTLQVAVLAVGPAKAELVVLRRSSRKAKSTAAFRPASTVHRRRDHPSPLVDTRAASDTSFA
jgi:hypothetical protein